MSDEAGAAMGMTWLRQGGETKISREWLEKLIKVLPTCTVGKKYGALCNDGFFSYVSREDTCEGHGGAKEWIECRRPDSASAL
jgi:hypothetical protein